MSGGGGAEPGGAARGVRGARGGTAPQRTCPPQPQASCPCALRTASSTSNAVLGTPVTSLTSLWACGGTAYRRCDTLCSATFADI
jgi:hypothetical protein